MSRRQLTRAWIQTSLLIALDLIATHEISRNAYTDVYDDPVLKNLTSLFSNRTAALNETRAPPASNGTLTLPASNATTFPVLNATDTESKHYYLNPKAFPRVLSLYALMVPLQFYWHQLLEYLFPTRPRGVEVHYERPTQQQPKEKFTEGTDGREEEVVQRWIAAGRVRRSSVSWWNTFVKWVLDLSVGKIAYEIVYHAVDDLVCLRLGWQKTVAGLRRHIIFCTLTSFLGIRPLASLIGFVVVPAHHRPAFQLGMGLVASVFISAFFRLTIPWLLKTPAVQSFLQNATETMQWYLDNPEHDPAVQMKNRQQAMQGRLIDEL